MTNDSQWRLQVGVFLITYGFGLFLGLILKGLRK